MTLLDLTHTITEDMPVYPGTEPPRLSPANTIERDGFRETLLSLYSHTGTHMDAPAHILPGASTLDALNVDDFAGSGAVVDCSDLDPEERISPARLSGLDLARTDFVLFLTGHSRHWGSPRYFDPYPVPSRETAELLAASGVKGVGIDAISVDPLDAADLPNHRIFFTSGLVIVENLTGLEALLGKRFTFFALPLKFDNADGAPVRAVAQL